MNRRRLAIGLGVALSVAIGIFAAFHSIRGDHVVVAALMGLLVAVPATRVPAVAVAPAVAVYYLYDFWDVFEVWAARQVTIEPVAELELALFGIPADGETLRPNEWLAEFASLPIDLLGGLVYATHLGGVVLLGLYLAAATYWRDSRRFRRRLHGFTWGFLAMNLIGGLIWVLWPVAPPWYLDMYGTQPPGEPIPGHPAGLTRVDVWLEFAYFGGVYDRSSYVFGAFPSLHVAYPIWVALHVRRFWTRAIAWTHAVLISFYAVYFNHHYVVDLIAGYLLVAIIWALWYHTPLKRGFEGLHARVVETLDGRSVPSFFSDGSGETP